MSKLVVLCGSDPLSEAGGGGGGGEGAEKGRWSNVDDYKDWRDGEGRGQWQ